MTGSSPTCPTSAARTPTDARHRGAGAQAGHPVITIPTRGPGDLGRIFLLAELATAVAGWGLQINPFDQPNVQQAKDATNTVLAGYEEQRRAARPSPTPTPAAAARAGARRARPRTTSRSWPTPRPTPAFDAAIAELRVAIRARRAATTTFGYGPRFLHSTGQFHKGGPQTGRFLQLLHDGPEDVSIPGRPFTLHDAQERPGDRRLRHPARARAARASGCACAVRTQ